MMTFIRIILDVEAALLLAGVLCTIYPPRPSGGGFS